MSTEMNETYESQIRAIKSNRKHLRTFFAIEAFLVVFLAGTTMAFGL